MSRLALLLLLSVIVILTACGGRIGQTVERQKILFDEMNERTYLADEAELRRAVEASLASIGYSGNEWWRIGSRSFLRTDMRIVKNGPHVAPGTAVALLFGELRAIGALVLDLLPTWLEADRYEVTVRDLGAKKHSLVILFVDELSDRFREQRAFQVELAVLARLEPAAVARIDARLAAVAVE